MQLTQSDLTVIVDGYRRYIRKAYGRYLISRRYGSTVQTVGFSEHFNSKLLEKVLNGNLSIKLTDRIVLPRWMSQEQFNKLLSTVKTTISNDQ